MDSNGEFVLSLRDVTRWKILNSNFGLLVHETVENRTLLFSCSLLFFPPYLAPCSLVRKHLEKKIVAKYWAHACSLLSLWELSFSCYNAFEYPEIQSLYLHSMQLTKIILASLFLSWHQEPANRPRGKAADKRLGLPQWPPLLSRIWSFKFGLPLKLLCKLQTKPWIFSRCSICSRQVCWSAAGYSVKSCNIIFLFK